MIQTRTKTHLLIAVTSFCLVGSFLLLAGWETSRYDFSACHQIVEQLRRVTTRDGVRRILEQHHLPAVESEKRLAAICRGTRESPGVLPYYPVMALHIEVGLDAQQRVTGVEDDDVMVIDNGTARARLYGDVGRQLGFRHYTPNRDGEERLALSHVQRGSPMAAAGFQPGDEIELDSVDELYYRIATNQRRTIRVTIRRNGTRRDLLLAVPDLRLRDDAHRALWFR